MRIALVVVGALIVLTVLQDLFTTVLFPAGGRGLIRRPLTRAVSAAFRTTARWVDRPQRRRSLLAHLGPTLIAVTSITWFLLLIIGWAFVYAPALGESIVAAQGPTDTSVTTALYYSGFTLTTLGTGDVVPTTGGYRLLTVIEAGLGFLTFTMSVSYFLSVYSNLTSRNAFALQMHDRTAGTGDAAVLLTALAEDDDAPFRGFLESVAASLRQIHETHRSYPVLRYFHYRERKYALPGVLLTVLDTTALLHSVLDPERHARVIRSSALTEVTRAADALLTELAAVPLDRRASREQHEAEWRARAERASSVLGTSGSQLRPDRDAAAAAYVEARSAWDARLRALAAQMSYEWEPTRRARGPQRDE